ncbi:cupin domain-containing protein [Endozoicomonas elysicola]|uniref:cupin domain-containing protein n=1 Tax=Endozoicomonas elysicola TaxID=305900 RepID=UPI00036DF65B|nr:cupin domain-containing protein [Endozoicomonas elysicola]
MSYTEHEFCQISEGISIVRDESGNEKTLKAGDHVVIPAGFAGEWEVIEPFRKIYTIDEQHNQRHSGSS